MQLTAFSQLISTHPLACTLPRHPHHTCRRLPPPAAMASPVATRSCDQITHSMPPEKLEVFKSLEPWVTQSVLPFLKPIEKCWQPSDFLPDPCSNEFIDQVRDLRQRTYEFPDDYLVVLVGDMITEDALPTYETWISSFDGVGDDSGCSPCPWAIWNRGWSAEENKHGDLLRTYLYLSGRVDMNMIEKTLQYLIGAGVDAGTENNPYLGFVYTSFQERATFISHGNTARLAKEGGDPILARICGTIAADEKRHENAYVKIVEKLLELDPNYTMLAIAKMMKKGVTMPGYLMYDGNDPCLFKHFSAVAQRLGVYTAHDYSNILEFLIDRWELEKTAGLTGEAKRAQDYVCGLPPKIKRLQERADDRAKKLEPREVKFSWIFNNKVSVL